MNSDATAREPARTTGRQTDRESNVVTSDEPSMPCSFGSYANIFRGLLRYIEIRKDLVRARTRHLALKSIIVCNAAVAWSVILIAACWSFVQGAVGAARDAFGNHAWAGELLVGGGLLFAMLLVTLIFAKIASRTAYQKTVRKYEHQHPIPLTR